MRNEHKLSPFLSKGTGKLELPLVSEMPTEPPEYTKLMHNVARQIESTPDGLMDFRNTCRAQDTSRLSTLTRKGHGTSSKTFRRR